MIVTFPPQSSLCISEIRARDNATNANINYFNVLEAAQVEWIEVRDNFPTLDFWGWADGHYPQLKQATDIRTRADKELHDAMELYFGPEAPILSGYMTTLGNAFNSSVSMPGLNQEGLINDQTLINKATDYANSGQKPPNTDITQSTVLVPAYTIPNYTSTVQSWITAGGHGSARDTIIPLDINAGKTTTWADYGFKEVHGGGGFGFWPFFHAEVMVNNERVERMLATIGREDAISLQAAMIGVQKDIPDIKTQFPDRLPAAPDVLSSKVAEIVSVLVGYDLKLRVQFAPEIRAEVDSIYEEVKATKGRMSIFGFHVSAGKAATHRTTSRQDSRMLGGIRPTVQWS
ncbi:hypothetical protein D9757_009752 [Collybiopsis confluens]|uniref:Uncharacterized protein n=1 Tax=Collybiopsis confluens TaxID=2823264 RepID=A0A8H5GYF8_9AGAR|nr:hypothetical protein D9757_009752 [Collybiopsis confluens]